MSFYHFSYDGGRGPGCYVEEPLTNGTPEAIEYRWIHYVAMVSKPEQRIWLYKDGELADTDGFDPAAYLLSIPDADLRNGGAPVRMGSQNGDSYFKGAIDNVYFYNRKLTPDEIRALHVDSTQ